MMPGKVAAEPLTWQEPPPRCGRRLPPALLDEIAVEDPERVLYSIAKSKDMADGFEDLTYKTVANAVNRCAHWLKETLGTSKSRVFCYLGPLDVRYLLLTLAAPKAGHTAFFTSHRNSLEAHLSLTERTGCTALLLPEDPLPIARQILEGRPMETISTPDLAYFLDEKPVEVVSFTAKFEDVKDKPFCILHTSGSTGIPKPVPVTYGSYAGMDSQLLIPKLGLKPTFLSYAQGKRVFLALPVFHAASLNWTTGIALFAGVTCILPPPAPLTADLASQVFEHSRAFGAIMAPSLAVDCYNNDTYCVRMLQNLNFIVYGGGMLPAEVGDVLCKRIRLMTLMGSCETALLPHQMHDDPRDWDYISLSPALGVEFKEERDGLCNLTIVRQKKYELHQGVFSTFPDRQEHPMGDLFERHPTRPNLWRFRARVDDILSFTTAEKLNPITMESVIQAHPLVRSAVIGGQGQFQASLLLEPREYPRNAAEKEAFLSAVWPSIHQANRGCPAHGRIMKGFVMLTDPAKPLPRASKDTVQRHTVFKLYEEEWKALYERQAQAGQIPKQPASMPAPAAKDLSSAATAGPTAGTSAGASTEATTAATAGLEAGLEASLDRLVTDKLAIAVEALVERKVAAALERLASVLLVAASQLQTGSSSSASSSSLLAAAALASQQNDPTLSNPVQTLATAAAPTPVPTFVPTAVNGTNGVHETSQVNDVHLTKEQQQPNGDSKPAASSPAPSSREALRRVIWDALAENLDTAEMTDEADLFKCGLDSVQVPPLLNAINAFIVRSDKPVELIESQVIYSNPTVSELLGVVG